MCILTILQISVFKEGQVRLQAWIFFLLIIWCTMQIGLHWFIHVLSFFISFNSVYGSFILQTALHIHCIALDWTAASAKYYSNLCCKSVTIFLFFIFCSLYHIYTYYCNWNVSSIILICIIGFNINYIVWFSLHDELDFYHVNHHYFSIHSSTSTCTCW